MLSSPNPSHSTPDSNLIDWALVRDLNLKMTDLQCTKFFFSGHKMRILGKISTTVQCIQDGRISGNFHIKARVVQDLYSNMETHGVTGNKLTEQLRGPKLVLDSEDETLKTPSKQNKKKKKSSSVDSSPSPPTAASVISTPSHTSNTSLLDVDWSPASPYTQNICLLEEMFGENTDLEPDYSAQQALLAAHDPDGLTNYGYEYQEDGSLDFTFTTTTGATFIPGHGREGCSAYACASALQKPHNCGYHDDWLLPDNFRGCGNFCRGGLCSCLRGGGGV